MTLAGNTALGLMVIAWMLLCYQALRDLNWVGARSAIPPVSALLPAAHPILSNNFLLFIKLSALVTFTHIAIYFVTYLAYIFLHDSPLGFIDSFKEIWLRWDSVNYLQLAEHGYQEEGEHRFLLVFFPLYPFLIRLVNYIVADYFLSGLIVSFGASISMAYVLFKLVVLDFGDEELAWRTIKLLLLFPFAFFQGIVYTESTFLFLSIASFYMMRQAKWVPAGLFGLLAATTRNHGLLLLLPMAYEVFRQNKQLHIVSFKHLFITWGKGLIGLCLILTGYFYYLALNKWLTGDWFKFLEYQKEHWVTGFGFFASNIELHLNLISEKNSKLSIGTWLPTFVLFFGAMSAIIASMRKVPISYTLYGLVYLLISYSPTWLLSGPRYVSGLFTLFVAIALWTKKRDVEWVIYLSFTLLLALYSILFFESVVY